MQASKALSGATWQDLTLGKSLSKPNRSCACQRSAKTRASLLRWLSACHTRTIDPEDNASGHETPDPSLVACNLNRDTPDALTPRASWRLGTVDIGSRFCSFSSTLASVNHAILRLHGSCCWCVAACSFPTATATADQPAALDRSCRRAHAPNVCIAQSAGPETPAHRRGCPPAQSTARRWRCTGRMPAHPLRRLS